jgi:hypothetical protein
MVCIECEGGMVDPHEQPITGELWCVKCCGCDSNG